MSGNNIKSDAFKTVNVKGKKGQTIDVCNYDKKIIIQPKDSVNTASKKVDACFDKKPKPASAISVGVPTLQAPDNDWMVLEDTDFYKVPDNQNGVPTKQKDKALGRISRVRANLVFVKYQGTLRKMLKLDRNAPYNFIDAETAIPYYQYVLKNAGKYGISPEAIAAAKKIDAGVKEGKFSFDGNTNLDLGIDGNTDLDLSFDGNTALDLSFDGDESNAIGGSKKFKVIKPQAKVFAQDKSTGVIHFTKRKLGKGSKVSGTILPKGDFKFRKKDKKTKAISLVTKSAGFVKIGENDKANMLVNIGALRPMVKKSSFEGNTTLDLGFDGNTNIDLSVQGGKVARRRRHKGINRRRKVGVSRGKHLGRVRSRKHSFDGNTNLDLGFDGNTNLDLGADGSRNRPSMDVTPNNLDLGVDGFSRMQRREMNVNLNNRLNDLSFNGGALEEDFHGGGDMLAFDGSEDMSNAFGDWVKKRKEKKAVKKIEKTEKKALSKEQSAVLADKNKVVYTEAEMKGVYQSSGSTKPFNEWTKSEGAKNMLNSIATFGAAWLNAKSKQASGETTDEGMDTNTGGGKSTDDTDKEKKILGMHPLTFGIVATVVGITTIGAIIYFNKTKSVSAIVPAT